MVKKVSSSQSRKTLLGIFIVGVAVYLGFTPLFQLTPAGVPQAVISSAFGAIFVIILTMYLLNKQTELEQQSKQSERIFDEKVKLYQVILDSIRDILLDGKITKEEMNRLPFPVIRMQMLGGDDAISSFQKVYEMLNKIYSASPEDTADLSDDDKTEIFKLMSKFAGLCRLDIGIADHDISEETFESTMQSISESGKKEIEFKHKALMINVNRSNSTSSLYDAVRYAWKLNVSKAEQADVILATQLGIVIGVFVADKWLPATTDNFPEYDAVEGRYGFIGKEAPESLKKQYLGKAVPSEFRKRGAANPIKYGWKD
jgi:hypothetical protein